MGVNMGGVNAAFGEDVDPDVLEFEGAILKFPTCIGCEILDMFIQGFDDVCKDRKALVSCLPQLV